MRRLYKADSKPGAVVPVKRSESWQAAERVCFSALEGASCKQFKRDETPKGRVGNPKRSPSISIVSPSHLLRGVLTTRSAWSSSRLCVILFEKSVVVPVRSLVMHKVEA